MTTTQAIPQITLKRGREVSVYRKHPWIFSGAVKDRSGLVTNGAFVEVLSHEGKYLGSGHWGTGGIAIRLLSFGKRYDEVSILEERLLKAVALRKALGLVGNPNTDSYRIIYGEGDGLPGLVVDRYADTCVIQCHSTGMWRLKDLVAKFVTDQKELGITRCLERRVDKLAEESDTPEVSVESELITIKENGKNFLVDVTNGQKTGFFLDQRSNRELVGKLASGRHVLNAFSYSGAFSVYALAGGAKWVTSVDASKSAIDLCRSNVTLNMPSPSHTAEVADCFRFLENISDSYDLIILDPPAFAKHQKAVQRGLQGYEAINTMALKGIKSGGILVTFSCSQLVSRDLFRDVVLRSAAAANRSVRILHQLHQAPCHPVNLFHPEGDYLKGLVLLVE